MIATQSRATFLLSLVAAAAATVPAFAQPANADAVSHVAIFRFDRAHLDAAIEAFHALAAASRRHPGNLAYDVYQGTADPLAFYVAERWASQSALDAHGQTEAFLKYGAGVLVRYATLHDTLTAHAFDAAG
jgi:quinol monooxygenase YgiN